jgi:nitrous oxidase accessory protein
VTPARAVRIAAALLAAGLVVQSAGLPLWSMKMQAPQYPKGLRLDAYGSGMAGDIRELNIINHYIGMAAIDPEPALETALFPVGIALLVSLCVLAPFHRWLRRGAIAACVGMPVGILADLQWWLYVYGNSLDPTAPIRLKPFTPLVFGSSTLGNFVTTSMISWGIVAMLAAALVLAAGEWLGRRLDRAPRLGLPERVRPITAAVAMAVALMPAATAAEPLQARIDAAAPGTTILVEGGVHPGPLVVRGPLTLVGTAGATIDGGGQGSVVTIDGEDVVFRGFIVRNSGRRVTEEAAGIKITGHRHRVADNHVHDVYFGIHVGNGTGHVISGNVIAPGERHGARPGHGISLWHVTDSELAHNRISAARDGIYLSFTERVVARDNEVMACRYGVHSMNSQHATFEGNRLTGNLLGAALMQSDRLVLRGNRIEQHREGSAAYGVLLKDIGDLTAEDNEILANRVGLYAESVPTQPSRQAVLARNVIAGNEVGLALQGSAALTLTGNRIAENLTDVRPLGRQLSRDMRWSREGIGNSWGEYRGYDADRDGIGDVPHRVEHVMDALLARTPLVQAFLYTPAHLAVEAAARMFPLLRQQPVLVDEHPLMRRAARTR